MMYGTYNVKLKLHLSFYNFKFGNVIFMFVMGVMTVDTSYSRTNNDIIVNIAGFFPANV